MEYKGKKIYVETEDKGYEYRKSYVDSIHRFIQKSMNHADAIRKETMLPESFVKNQEVFRKQYMKMIGVPPKPDNIPNVQKNFVAQDDMCSIYRLSIEVTEEFFFYGILFIPHGAESVPLVIAQHGGGGSPEFCSDMYGENNYSNFTKRALERGACVFAPQILTWGYTGYTGDNKPNFKVEYNRGKIDSDLKQVGMSVTGLEIFCIMRSIDYLSTLEEVDENSIGMVGLSYGGFYSLYTAAADTRIKSIYTAAAFNDKSYICFDDWAWKDSAYQFHDAEVVGLCAPRKLWIDVGQEDPVFYYEPSIKEAERAAIFYKAAGVEKNFTYNLWAGGHKFNIEKDGFELFFKELFDN